jgi:hypothetical protein
MISIVDKVVMINNIIVTNMNQDATAVFCYVIFNNVVVSSTIKKDANVGIVGYYVFNDVVVNIFKGDAVVVICYVISRNGVVL